MGSVKVDLHSKEMFYQNLTFSDIDTVHLLLEYRHKYDKYIGHETNNFFHEAGQVTDLNQEVIATYADLDTLLKDCALNGEQLMILKMIWEGFSYEEIARHLKKDSKTIVKKFRTICNKVVKQNNRRWRIKFYTNDLGLVTKNCSRCKKDLPATDEFYHYDKSNNTYKSACISCR